MIRNKNSKFDVGGGEEFADLSSLGVPYRMCTTTHHRAVEFYKKNPMVETNGNVVNIKNVRR